MKEKINLIFIGNSKKDVNSCIKFLEKDNFKVIYKRVVTSEQFTREIQEIKCDLIISEYELPEFRASTALELLQKLKKDIPFIVLTESHDDRIAVKMMKKGAHNFIFKNKLDILPGIVRSELSDAEIRSNKNKDEEPKIVSDRLRYESLFNDSPVPLWEEDLSMLYDYFEELKTNGVSNFRDYFDKHPGELKTCIGKIKVKDVNQAALLLHGSRNKQDLLRSLNTFAENSINVFKEKLIAIANGQMEFESEAEIKTLSGERKNIFLRLKIDEKHHKLNRALLATTDITKQKHVEKELTKNEKRLKESQRLANLGSWELDLITGELEWSEEIYKIFEINPDKFLASYEAFLNLIHPDDREVVDQAYTNSLENKTPYDITHRLKMPYGRIKYVNEQCETMYNKAGNPIRSVGTVQDITDRVIAQEKLKEAHQLLELVFDNTHIMIAYMDKNFNFLRVNRAYAIADNHQPSYFPGLNHFDLYPSEENKAIFQQVVKTGEPHFSYMKPFNHPELGLTYWDWSLVPIKDQNRKVRGLILSLLDVTKRKLAENKILESQKRFKDLANLLPQTIYEADLEGNIIFANKAALTTFGYTDTDISAGVNTRDFISEKDRDEALKNIQRILKGRHSGKNEYEMKRKDGTVFPSLAFTSPIIREGKPIGIRGTIVDITKTKQTEIELRKLSEAVAQSPASIIITKRDGSIEYVNKAFEQITGYKFHEVRNENPRIFKSGNTKKEVYTDLWNTIIAGNIWQGELLNKKKNGELYWENTLISPIKDINGKTINFVAVKQDTTEKKKMMNELIEAKEKAEEMNRVKTVFFANMSHELRTPFVGIMGYAELLSETLSDPEAKEMAEGILNTSIRMKDTLTKILSLAKLEFTGIELVHKKVDIRKILETVNKQFSIVAQRKNLYFTTELNVDEYFVETDETLLLEIVNNLVNNAISYTFDGGIKLSVENKMKGIAQCIAIKVTDTGIGIQKDKQKLIWEEFRQGSEGLNRSYQGTGLGLSIVKKCTELLDGKIYLKSSEGNGSTFTIELPVSVSNSSARGCEPINKEKYLISTTS